MFNLQKIMTLVLTFMPKKIINLPNSSKSDPGLSFLHPLPLAAFLGHTTVTYSGFFKLFISISFSV